MQFIQYEYNFIHDRIIPIQCEYLYLAFLSAVAFSMNMAVFKLKICFFKMNMLELKQYLKALTRVKND